MPTGPARIALAGLGVLSAWLLAVPPAGPTAALQARLLIGTLCAAPLLLLILTGLRRRRQWGAWVAIVMIPYFALSIGTLIVAEGRRFEQAAFSALIVAVFFAGIGTSRERQRQA